MQQPNNNPNSTNPVVEVALIVIAGMLIIIGAVLLYLGKIDIGFASFLFMTAFSAAFGLLGINLAYKAPSPTQQAQLSAQQQNVQQIEQNVQQIASQALAVLPMFANLLHSHAPAQSAAPQPQQNQVPASDPRVQAAAIGPQPTTNMTGTAPTAVMRQPVTQPPQVQQVPMQQSVPQAPPLPQASPQAQQFKPPVFTPLPDISMPMASMPAGQPPQQ